MITPPMAGDEYMSLLENRQREAIASHSWPTMETHGYEVKDFAKVMAFPLERMILPGDEHIFTPPAKEPKPKPKPRHYRPSSHWEERVEKLTVQLDRVVTRGMPDQFDHAMVNLPLKGRAITDSQLDQYRKVSGKLKHAEWMLRRAKYREAVNGNNERNEA